MNFRLRIAAFAAASLLACSASAQLRPAPTAPAAPAAPASPAPAPAGSQDIKSDLEKENAGRLAAHAWLLLLDRRDWGTAWDSASALFRKNVPLSAWMDAIPKVRQPMGALVEREALQTIYKTSLPGQPNGDYVTVTFRSKFAERENLEELLTTVREPDGRWRVTGYSPK